MIWEIKQMPRREPKFHHAEMLGGVGRSIRELLMIFRRGWDLRRFGAIGVGLSIIRMVRVDRANVLR